MTSKEPASLKAIDRSMQELHAVIDSHRSLMVSIFGQEKTGMPTENPPCPPRSGEGALKDVIREAIDVLEESRKAFKSKKLESLRKKLTNALIEPYS
ncbi:MAG: hypothetical protein GY846_23020 [Deltaproteobacteria bacterium]|nr:hypothetical protein [Deltaproteobacteria bacterium]